MKEDINKFIDIYLHDNSIYTYNNTNTLSIILTMTMFGSCAKIAIKLPSPLKDMPLISELYINHRNLLVMIMVVR